MRFNKFLSTLPELDVLIKYSKKKSKYQKIDDLLETPFKFLKEDFKHLVDNGRIEKALYLMLKKNGVNINYREFLFGDNYEKALLLFWVFREYDKINNMEKVHLSSTQNNKLVKAGVSKLDILGNSNIIDFIVKEYGYTHAEAWQLPYSLVFEIRLRNKIIREINENLEK